MLAVNLVSLPKIVSTGEQFKIEVIVESNFYFDDIEQMNWDTVENRGLLWRNIDDTPNFDDSLEQNTWALVETNTWDDIERG
ncbi:hypothetical protein ACNQFZ_18575 [Schinkia sp. CFF1]